MVQAGGRGPIGQTRNPTQVLVISLLCGFYGFYQVFQELGELRAYRGKDDINPIVATLLWIVFCWGMPAKMLEAKQMAGIPNPQVGSPILYFLVGYWAMAKDLNEIWAASGGGQPQHGPDACRRRRIRAGTDLALFRHRAIPDLPDARDA